VKEDRSEAELREKLAAWRIKVYLPQDFQQRVWKRIAVREVASSDFSLLTWLKSLSNPNLGLSIRQLALSVVVVGLFVGTTTGVVEASRWNSATWNRLEAKYVQSIDPYQRIPSS